MSESESMLRRYIDLGALVHMLSTKTITFLDPQKWDDRNDAYFMELYREKQKLSSLLALCFSQYTETSHHWHTYSHSPGGVCVVFHKKALIDAIGKSPEDGSIRKGKITYKVIKTLRNERPFVNELPFIKRYPYEHETEYRIIWESRTQRRDVMDVKVPISCISQVVLSPWSAIAVSKSVTGLIHSIKGCGNLSVIRSTLISNDQWKRYGDEARLSNES